MIVMDTRSQLTENKTPDTVKQQTQNPINVAELGCCKRNHNKHYHSRSFKMRWNQQTSYFQVLAERDSQFHTITTPLKLF